MSKEKAFATVVVTACKDNKKKVKVKRKVRELPVYWALLCYALFMVLSNPRKERKKGMLTAF